MTGADDPNDVGVRRRIIEKVRRADKAVCTVYSNECDVFHDTENRLFPLAEIRDPDSSKTRSAHQSL